VIIRKLFKFENAHIVRGCSTQRCSFNIHGHSYKVEVLLESDYLDNGDMVYDFGLIKLRIKDLIAVSVFAFVPFVLSIFLLLPVEVGLFGEFWFTFHPFPWVIKSFPAYFLLFIHGLMLAWSLFLFFIGVKRIYGNSAIALSSWLLFIALLIFILN
jgi:hypothetical protein